MQQQPPLFLAVSPQGVEQAGEDGHALVTPHGILYAGRAAPFPIAQHIDIDTGHVTNGANCKFHQLIQPRREGNSRLGLHLAARECAGLKHGNGCWVSPLAFRLARVLECVLLRHQPALGVGVDNVHDL